MDGAFYLYAAIWAQMPQDNAGEFLKNFHAGQGFEWWMVCRPLICIGNEGFFYG
jgi:hypothetical protein